MKYILTLFVLTLFIQSCKSTHTTVTDTQVISDTLIKYTVEAITLPTNYTFIEKSPCKNDSLVISNQFIEIGKLRLKIKNIKGQLVVEVNTDSIINSRVKEILKHSEKRDKVTVEVITKKYIPKWLWYLIGFNVVYIAYRVARVYFPVIRWLPY